MKEWRNDVIGKGKRAFIKVWNGRESYGNCENIVGHEVGGVCPFGIPDNVTVYPDVSLKRFDAVYPACGSHNSAIKLTIAELEQTSENEAWIDVCKEIG